MKSKPVEAKPVRDKGPIEVAKEGSSSVPIYATTNRIYRLDPATGHKVLKSEHPQFTVIYYEGSRRVKRKFADLGSARREAELAATKLANGEVEVLRLKGTDREDYVHAVAALREWNPSAHLSTIVTDYVASMKRLPENTNLKEVVDFFVKRHPVGLPPKTVREVVDELIGTKAKSGKSRLHQGPPIAPHSVRRRLDNPCRRSVRDRLQSAVSPHRDLSPTTAAHGDSSSPRTLTATTRPQPRHVRGQSVAEPCLRRVRGHMQSIARLGT